MFHRLSEDVCIHEISDNDIVKWRGKHDFLFRVKIKALDFIANKFPNDHVLFLDSDTTVEADPATLIAMLDRQHPVMHMNEKTLSESKDKADKALVIALNGFQFKNYKFDEQTCMFNSGVIGLPASDARYFINESIELCDAICETPADRSFIEQLAIGMVLFSHGKLETAENMVIHYWGNKQEWNKFIEGFVVESALKNLTKAQEVQFLNEVDLQAIPIKSRAQINNQRLKSLADKLFPKKRQQFFSQT